MNEAHTAAPVAAEGLTRDFGNVRAVDDLTFRVERGEIVGILGPNGAGKTTTLRMLTGGLIPTKGRVRLGGFDVLLEGPRARAHLGYLPEQMPLYGEMTVFEFLSFVAAVKGLIDATRTTAVGEMRARLDLGDVWSRPTRVLSRGYRQRVGLAQALLGDPQLLVLDEPTAGLDPNQIHDFRMLVRRLGADHAILLSTHILPEALQVCDRVMILNRGRLVAMDRPERLGGDAAGRAPLLGHIRLDRKPEVSVEGARIEKQAEESLWRIEGLWSQETADQVLRHLVDQGASIVQWRRGPAPLEEIFRKLTLGEEPS
jgi:ABC-2 type transport system ATP-binding protein